MARELNDLKDMDLATLVEELRLELYEKVNALGIGAQGLGGLVGLALGAEKAEAGGARPGHPCKNAALG